MFVAAADVSRRQPAIVVAAAGFFLRLEQASFRAPLRDFIESRQRLETQRRRQRAKFFQGHNFWRSDEIDLLALLQGDNGFLPARAPPDWSSQALLFSGVITG